MADETPIPVEGSSEFTAEYGTLTPEGYVYTRNGVSATVAQELADVITQGGAFDADPGAVAEAYGLTSYEIARLLGHQIPIWQPGTTGVYSNWEGIPGYVAP